MMASAPVFQDEKVRILKDRSDMLRNARAFFADRGISEVDCPALSAFASVDVHIDLIRAQPAGKGQCYLHSSPEYGMKRLLAMGLGDIFQLSHVFRDGESGSWHHPEFMMAEWYREGFSFQEMINETVEFAGLFLGTTSVKQVSYREAFQCFLGLDYFEASLGQLRACLEEYGISVHSGVEGEDKDGLLNLLLSHVIEPNFCGEMLWVISHYPASQAALSRTFYRGEEPVAERFEVYYQGVELANGYHELIDPVEQRKRFGEANEKRQRLGKKNLPVDERFLRALEDGLPDCCGVAVGFDRLMMMRHNKENIGDVTVFSWHEA